MDKNKHEIKVAKKTINNVARTQDINTADRMSNVLEERKNRLKLGIFMSEHIDRPNVVIVGTEAKKNKLEKKINKETVLLIAVKNEKNGDTLFKVVDPISKGEYIKDKSYIKVPKEILNNSDNIEE